MNLTGNNESVTVVSGAAVATDWVVEWTDIDKTSSTSTTPDSGSGQISTATTTTVISAPASSVYRMVRWLSFRNVGAASQTLTIRKTVVSSDRVVMVMTLQAGESVNWSPTSGWQRLSATGVVITSPLVAATSSVLGNPLFASANLTATKTITNNSTFAVYSGRAPRALTSVQLRNRVTTAMATITWGEVAVAKGAIVVGGNPSLTVVGWADVSGTFNSLGQKTTTINVSAGQVINEGDDLWTLIGNSATTACVVRAQSIADDLQVGVQGSLATRPSLNVGNAQTYTIESATALAAWCALVV